MTLRPHNPEQTLWRCVVAQAATDAVSTSNEREVKRERENARRWLTSNSKDFRLVCTMADYEPERIREYALTLAAQGWPSPVSDDSKRKHRKGAGNVEGREQLPVLRRADG